MIHLSSLSPNGGITLSRQILAERAKGKYMIPFDQDDAMVEFDLAAEIEYMEANPEVGATYSLKYFFEGDHRFSYIGAMPPSPFVSMFSMTAVPNGAILDREKVMRCGCYANISRGLGDDVIMFSRLGEWYRCELRMAPRVIARKHSNSAGAKSDYAGYAGYSRDILARLRHRSADCAMLENFQLPHLPDYQILALAGGIFYLRQSQGDFALKFLEFLASRYTQDFGLQNIYMKFLLLNRRFTEFEAYWQQFDTFGSNIPFAAAMWLAELAGIARQVGHSNARLEEIAAVLQRYLTELPSQVKRLLK